MRNLKGIDFLGAAVGILIIGGWAAMTDAQDASPEWFAGFGKAYLASVPAFSLSCAMLARRAGKSLAYAAWGLLCALGVVIVLSSAFEMRT